MLHISPISYKDASEFVRKHHRHHGNPPARWKYGACVKDDNDNVVGVIMVGRPVSRILDDGYTVEVNRCCTDGTKNACSMLYAVARRVAKEIGYKRIITYILETEDGTSLKASGWTMKYKTQAGSWNTPARKRTNKSPTCSKILWESILC